MAYSFSNYAPHYRALLQLGIPLVIGQIGTIILGFADTLMIGIIVLRNWLPPVS